MLTGYDIEPVAFYVMDTAEYLCRGCAVKAHGSIAVERSRMGLSERPLEVVSRYSAVDAATDNGYDHAEDRGDKDGFSAVDAELLCCECGAVLARDGRHPSAEARA